MGGVLLYRRSAFLLGGVDDRGAIEIEGVHRLARAEIEARQG